MNVPLDMVASWCPGLHTKPHQRWDAIGMPGRGPDFCSSGVKSLPASGSQLCRDRRSKQYRAMDGDSCEVLTRWGRT